MDRWLKLDPTRYVGGHDATDAGSAYRAVNSPYDIPQAIKAFVDDDRKMLVIEFQYLINDRPVQQREIKAPDGSVRLFTGINSGRLLKIESDLGVCKPEQLQEALQLVEHIAGIIRSKNTPVTARNVASQVLEDSFKELVK